MARSNVSRLISLRMALIVLEDYGPWAEEVMECITSGEIRIIDKEATEWVKHTIDTILAASDNPYKDREEVAAAILKKIRSQGRN